MSARSSLRVLIADDSLTVRRRLRDVLQEDPGIEVVGEAATGAELITLCEALKPDVISLDVLMPGMDGVRATEEIMARMPTPILVVSSTDNRNERLSTMAALAAGAVDVIEKPSSAAAQASFDQRYLRALKLVSRIAVITHPRARLKPSSVPSPALPAADTNARSLVALGASTGGPMAVAQILGALPKDFAAPILLVMHIGHSFGLTLAEWLASLCRLSVLQAQGGETVSAGKVFVCPPDRHLVIQGGRLELTRGPERHSCRPSVDVLFESVAEQYGARAVGCLLTGIGRDGAAGLLAMRQRGALTIAQDEASCTVFGMPRAAIELGAAMHVADPSSISSLLSAATRRPRG
jgi:two-component system chemotaxis response regulator CheB